MVRVYGERLWSMVRVYGARGAFLSRSIRVASSDSAAQKPMRSVVVCRGNEVLRRGSCKDVLNLSWFIVHLRPARWLPGRLEW
eukprot:SAG11_NODE_3178_length_2629_cov_5.173123_2_plen_83_part_00